MTAVVRNTEPKGGNAMTQLLVMHFTATTADDERSYFTGDREHEHERLPGDNAVLPAGLYRIINGRLYMILSGGLGLQDAPIPA